MAIRGRMSREDRAKQFMPFAALKGYQEALKKKEKLMEANRDTKTQILEDEKNDSLEG